MLEERPPRWDFARAGPARCRGGARVECAASDLELPFVVRARLDAAAEFAWSVAHALNNGLCVASGNLRLLKTLREFGGESADLVQEALSSPALGETLAVNLGYERLA